MRKKIFILVLVFLVVGTLPLAGEEKGIQITQHFKFAWIMPDMFNPFWIYMRQGAEKAALEYLEQGIKVDVQQMAPIKTFNVEEQVAIFENAIQMKVDGVGICVIDHTAVIEQVNKAAGVNIPTIALSTDIPDSKRLAFSGVDDRLWAANVAEYAIKHNGEKGSYIVLEGIPGNYISELRTAGFKDAVKKYPNATLLEVQPAYFNREKGMAAMENMLTKYGRGKIQGIFTVNDEVALGAIEAIEAADRAKEIVVTGIDGNKDAAEAILKGRILCTVSDDPWAKGYEAVKALVAYNLGEKVPEVLPIKAFIVDKSNAGELLKKFPEMDKYYKP
jgi:ribose transport system substrate-binding protein